MPDRKSLISTLWLTLFLALMASVLAAPIQTSEFGTVSSQSDYVSSDFALSPARHTPLLNAGMASVTVQKMKALPSTNEEEQDWTDALDEPRVSFLFPCSFRKVYDRQLVAPHSILSLYPLRC